MAALVIVKGKIRSKDQMGKVLQQYTGRNVNKGEKQTTSYVFENTSDAVSASLELHRKQINCRIAPETEYRAARTRPRVRKALLSSPHLAFQRMQAGHIGVLLEKSQTSDLSGFYMEPAAEGSGDGYQVVRPIVPKPRQSPLTPKAWQRAVLSRGRNKTLAGMPADVRDFQLACELLGFMMRGSPVHSHELPAQVFRAQKIAAEDLGVPFDEIVGIGYGHSLAESTSLSIVVYTKDGLPAGGTIRIDPLGTFPWFRQSLAGFKAAADRVKPQIGTGVPSHGAVAVEPMAGRYGTVGGYVKRKGVVGDFGLTCAHVVNASKMVTFSVASPKQYEVDLLIHPSMVPDNAVDLATIGPIAVGSHGELPTAVTSWVDSLDLGAKLTMFGATSGQSESVVQQIVATRIDLSDLYNSRVPLWFSGIALCRPFSTEGDSGAVAKTLTGQAAGLVIAGCSESSVIQSFGQVAIVLETGV